MRVATITRSQFVFWWVDRVMFNKSGQPGKTNYRFSMNSSLLVGVTDTSSALRFDEDFVLVRQFENLNRVW